jgi:hypothetical protein
MVKLGWPTPSPLTAYLAGPRGLECISGVVVALPLTIASSQFVIGSFEARFFCAAADAEIRAAYLNDEFPNDE